MTIDRSSWWWRKGRAALMIAVSLLAAGVVAEPLQTAAWAPVRASLPEFQPQDLGDNLGQGTLLGMFGGFRTILADFVWLRGYVYWEQRDLPNAVTMINLATTLEPRTTLFWETGAEIIAYDLPSWTMNELANDLNSPDAATRAAAQAKWDQSQHDEALHAIAFLERGLKFHTDDYELHMTEALIYEKRLDDLPRAAEQYRLAAEVATAQSQRDPKNARSPYLPVHLYIRKLLAMGNQWAVKGNQRAATGYQREAYDYLRQIYPTLPASTNDSQKGVMSDWMRLLEKLLNLPHDPSPQFAPPAGWQPAPDAEYMMDFYPDEK
jgi:hypothetical protein